MKNTLIYLLAASTALFASCEKDGLSVTFDLPYATDFTIESILITNVGMPIHLSTPEVTTHTSEKFAANNTQIDRLEKANLKALTLTIVAPDGQTFSFLKEVKLYIKGEDLNEELVASKINVDESSGILIVDIEPTDVVGHIKSGKFSLRASITTNELISENVDVNASMIFSVTAKVL